MPGMYGEMRVWQYVAQDGRRSQACYLDARTAAMAAYWDNVNGQDAAIADLSGEAVIQLAAEHGYTVVQEPER